MTHFRLFCCAALISLFSLCAHAENIGEITHLYKTGKSDKALELLNAYLGKLPKDAWGRNVTQARFLKGVILAEQKRPREAIQVFLRLTQDYPALPEPYNNLAALYASQGQYEAARDALERAISTNPSYATAHENLSDIYAKLASQAYDNTLHAAEANRDGKPAPALITELCNNYGKMAGQVAGRNAAIHSADNLALLRGINMAQNSATKPPAKVDIDEMAMAPEDEVAPPEKIGKMPQVKGKPTPPPATAVATPAPAKQDKTSATTTATAPESAAKPDNSDEQRAVIQAVQNWAAAWSKKSASAYLGFYARDFKTPGGESRREWETTRKERIDKPKSIKVAVESPQVTLVDANHVKISFRQMYHSDTLQTSTHKTLLMVKSGSRWLIQEEQVAR